MQNPRVNRPRVLRGDKEKTVESSELWIREIFKILSADFADFAEKKKKNL